MHSSAPRPQDDWLAQNGPKELELLLRARTCHPSEPILIADNRGHYCDASFGAMKMLGLSREKIIGRHLEDFVAPGFKPEIPGLWKAFLQRGEQAGTLLLVGPDGNPCEVEYIARGNVLPARHLLVFHYKTVQTETEEQAKAARAAWVQDYALFLLNVDGNVAAWHSGAERIYGYSSAEVIGQPASFMYPSEKTLVVKQHQELNRSDEGHFVYEGWCMRKAGARFWAHVITVALKNRNGELQGFAGVARDFSERHQRDQKLRRTGAHPRLRSLPAENMIAGVVSGEFERVTEANDMFLELLGYSRQELVAGQLHWQGLTPPEYAELDDVAHEDVLRFGASTPFEKELIRKDGMRVPVLVVTAVLELSPFRWITFVQDLRGCERYEVVPAILSPASTGESDDSESDDSESDDGIGEKVVEIKNGFEEIIGRSPAVKRILRQLEMVAPTNATVLILGETGTGKQLMARAVHQLSPRRNHPFITLNCAAIPTVLLEGELFGYERGAFSGAVSQKIGRFERANGGTLFLDEVGDIPLDLQPKLLRALQEKAFERLGGTKTIPIDVRLVAATNRNLTQMMGDKLFRSDLYYRLKVFPITTPPLRDHPEDIAALARHFIQKYALEMNRQVDTIPSDTMRALVRWPWPGNVRELENFIQRGVILSQGRFFRAPLDEIRPDALASPDNWMPDHRERDHITRVLLESGGVIRKAATRLGMPRTTLNALMRRLDISHHDL
jgi:formate hydrogenlyase transcriptional activator